MSYGHAGRQPLRGCVRQRFALLYLLKGNAAALSDRFRLDGARRVARLFIGVALRRDAKLWEPSVPFGHDQADSSDFRLRRSAFWSIFWSKFWPVFGTVRLVWPKFESIFSRFWSILCSNFARVGQIFGRALQNLSTNFAFCGFFAILITKNCENVRNFGLGVQNCRLAPSGKFNFLFWNREADLDELTFKIRRPQKKKIKLTKRKRFFFFLFIIKVLFSGESPGSERRGSGSASLKRFQNSTFSNSTEFGTCRLV